MAIETVDDFEDGDIVTKASNWNGWNGSTDVYSADNRVVLEGSLTGSLYTGNTAETVYSQRDTAEQPSEVVLEWEMEANQPDNTSWAAWEILSGTTRIMSVRFKSGGDMRLNMGSVIAAGYSVDTHYRLRFHNLDFSNNQCDIEITDVDAGSTFLSQTGVGFENGASGVDRVQVAVDYTDGFTDPNVYQDKIEYTTPTAPAAPSNLSTTVVSGDQVDLSWTDNASSEDGFYVYRAQSTGSTTADYTQIADLAADTTTYSDTGLEDGEKYYYRVSAYNEFGESDLSNEADAITDLPAASNVTLDASVEDEIAVSWTRNDDSPDGEWEVYRSTDGTLGTLAADTLALSTTSFTDTGLSDGEKYYYTVRRVTDHASSDSGQPSAVTVLPAPTSLASPAHTADSIDLSWTDNHDYGDTQVQYKPSDVTSWTTFSTLAIGTNAETVTGLRNGELYDLRVLAHTEHTTTEDA